LEYLTGGYIRSGYHEVINTEEVQRKAKEALMQGRKPWRISSTMFAHLRGDTDLYPRGHYLTS
jgi:isopenicillin N synthase-like dioxygenase